jgi:MauM/NapG family ferredoxin protein
VRARRATQLASLALALGLFAATRTGEGFAVHRATELFFLLDPLVAISALLAGIAAAAALAGLAASAALALLAGRSFCGWICPLGTSLDIVRRVVGPLARPLHRLTHSRPSWSRARYGVLLAVALATLLGLPLLGLVEPFAILTRGWTAVADAAGRGIALAARGPSGERPTPNRPLEEAGIHFIQAPVRPSERSVPALAWTSALVLFAVLSLEAVQPRFWCRNLCPTGAFLALLARRSLIRRLPRGTCDTCTTCVDVCKAGAFDAAYNVRAANCTLCMSCLPPCPASIIRFARRPGAREAVDWSRRAFLVSGAAGLAAPALAPVLPPSAPAAPHRLRPPGAAAQGERRFLTACVRCGECIKVCPTSGLQLTGLADGPEGLFAPRLVPRRGPCEYECRACAEVCPTGAIPALSLAAKQRTPIGLAMHDHRRCLPWAVGGECRVCREHCPAPGKAIQLKLGRAADGGAVMLPYVDAGRCIGCGTCEFVCPVEGVSGIRVFTRASAEAMRPVFQPPRPGVGWSEPPPSSS